MVSSAAPGCFSISQVQTSCTNPWSLCQDILFCCVTDSDFADSWKLVLARRSGPRSLRPHFAMHFRTIQVTQWHQHAHSFCFSDPKVNDICDARDTVIHQWQLQVLLRSSAAIWMSQTSMAALVKMEAAGWACTECPELKSSVFQGLKMSKSSC